MVDGNIDIAKSVFSGSIRFFIPALLFVILYYVILRRWGPETFGLWSLFAAALSFASLSDIGLSQTLTREGGPDLKADRQREVMADRVSAGRFYAVATAVALAVAASTLPLFSGAWVESGSRAYNWQGVYIATLITIVGAGIKQYAKLDLGLAAAYGAAAPSFRLQGYGQVILLAIAFASSGTFPIEGLAVGLFASGVFEAIFSRKLAAEAGCGIAGFPSVSARNSVSRVINIVRRGKFLYLTTLGGTIREPLYRAIIAAYFGFAIAGYFDIALRATKTAREVGVFGLSATFPYFSRHFRESQSERARELMRWTLSLSLILGTLPLATMVALSHPIYHAWLGHVSDDVIVTTAFLAFWFWMTLANIPFWYAALASRLDRNAAASVWMHAASVLALIPLIPMGVTYYGTLAIWVAGASLTQLVIVVLISSRLVGYSVFTTRIFCQLAVSLGLISLAIGLTLSGWWNNWQTAHIFVGTGALGCLMSLLIGLGLSDLSKLYTLLTSRMAAT